MGIKSNLTLDWNLYLAVVSANNINFHIGWFAWKRLPEVKRACLWWSKLSLSEINVWLRILPLRQAYKIVERVRIIGRLNPSAVSLQQESMLWRVSAVMLTLTCRLWSWSTSPSSVLATALSYTSTAVPRRSPSRYGCLTTTGDHFTNFVWGHKTCTLNRFQSCHARNF